jgi:hypothetical protein
LTTFPILTGYVPYTGATANVDLGAFDLTADLITGATGSFASSGGSDTFAINHSSGGGIALNITKGGNGEGLYINKTSGSGNAATIVGTLEATTLVKSGGTSSQFLKADGTVDSNTYALDSLVVHLAGTETITGAIKTFSSFDTLFSQGFFSDYAIKIKKDGFISLLNGYVSIGEISGTGTSKIVFGDGNSAFSNSLLFNTSSDKIYTFPNANGTVALTSDLSAYVTLAGTETITGAKTFSGLTSFTNTSGINLQYGAYINKGNTPLAFSSGNTNIYSDATTNNIVIRDNLSIAKLEFNNSTQTYTFPAATGTIALTSDLSSYVPYSGATGAVNLGAYDLTVNGIKVGIGGGSGANNTRLGSDTLSSLTTASNNVAIGANALFSATSGNANAGIGANALYAITTGIINTAIGFSAGSSITTGSYNTIVGKYVGTATLDSNVVLADGIGNIRFQWDGTNILLNGNTAITKSGTITTNYLPKFTGTSTIGNSIVQDDGSSVTIGGTLQSFNASPIYLFSTASTSNYEVLAIDKSATDARIRVYKSGTGSYRDLTFETGGSTTLRLASTGAATFSSSVQANGVFRQYAAADFYSDFAYNGTTYNFGSSETADNVDFKIAGGATWTTGGNFRFWTQAGASTPLERMRITSGGNVLIGTTNIDIGGSVAGTIIRSNGTMAAAINMSSPANYTAPISADRMNTAGDGLMYGMWRQGIFQAGIGATNGQDMYFYTGDGGNSSQPIRMTIKRAGDVGIGITSPLQTAANRTVLTLNAVSSNVLNFGIGGTLSAYIYSDASNSGLYAQGNLYLQADGASFTSFVNNSVERMRITSGGFLKASNTGTYFNAASYHELRANTSGNWVTYMTNTASTNPYGLIVNYTGASPNGSQNEFFYAYDTGGERFGVRSNGGIANYQANDVNLSDIRTKKDIIPLESYWDKFKAIEIVKFKYKDQTHDDFNIGVIAQQVESVAPEFIDTDGFGETPKDGVPLKTVYTADLHHATIKVLQECMLKIEEQQKQIEELKQIVATINK